MIPGLVRFAGPVWLVVLLLGFVLPNTTALALAPFDRDAGTASALLGSLQYGTSGLATLLVSAAFDGTLQADGCGDRAVRGWGVGACDAAGSRRSRTFRRVAQRPAGSQSFHNLAEDLTLGGHIRSVNLDGRMTFEPTHPSRRALLLGLMTSVTAAACGGSSNDHRADAPSNRPGSRTCRSPPPTSRPDRRRSRQRLAHRRGLLRLALQHRGTDNKGALFDTSLQTGRTPFQLVLGAGSVIQGWEQGIPGMKVGGIRRLIVPPALAYGATGSGSIPPNATLVFEMRLNDILVSAT